MRITIQPYRAYDINQLSERSYTATLFGDPKIVERLEEDGTKTIEHEVTVLHSGLLPVSSISEAHDYMELHYSDLLLSLSIEAALKERLKLKEESEQYLKATDYRTLKAVREIPEIAAKLEELYPGELERNIAAAKGAHA